MLFIEPRTKKYAKGKGFSSFARNLFKKYGQQLLVTATKSGINASKKSTSKSSESNR